MRGCHGAGMAEVGCPRRVRAGGGQRLSATVLRPKMERY
jgi:hypothetical protein